MKGGDSSHGICDFLLSWEIKEGKHGETNLSNLNVGLAGSYTDADPEKLWHVILYVDEKADPEQQKCLEGIFLGREKGTSYRNYASAITEVYAVRRARIVLDHTKNHETIRIGQTVSASTGRAVNSEMGVSCGIPGHDNPGQEVIAKEFRVNDAPFDFDFEGRCGFASKFSYRSD